MSLFRGESASAPSTGPAESRSNRFVVVRTLEGATAATAANYGNIFTAPFPCKVIQVTEIHETASSSGTLDITKDTGTQAPAAGGSIFASGTFNLAATANTLQTKSNVDGTDSVLAAGNRLGLKDGGTLTSGAGVSVTIVLEAI